jgi:uncharacterized protein (TIGR00730 family)
MTNKIKRIGIFCSGKNDIKQEYIDIVSSILNRIDTEKIGLVYGGGNVGLMGVIRQVFNGSITSSNLECFRDKSVDTPKDDYIFQNISQRQSKLIELSDMFLVLPGGFGTLYECLEVITKSQIGEHSKKTVIFNYKGIFNPLVEQITVLQNEGFIKKQLHQYNVVFLTESDIDILIDLIHQPI